MPKRILIVESDAAVSSQMRSVLEGKGFTVDETQDGKGSVELIRGDRPDLLLLAVDLSAGQNGYLICGKLKKDDDLKTVPVIIVGNPDGFAQHKKLKTRADEYLAKPVNEDELVDRVGSLIGLPDLPEGAVVEDESLSLGELVEDDVPTSVSPLPSPEEIAVEAAEETVGGDPELDALDAAFDDIHTPSDSQPGSAPAAEEQVSMDDLGDEPVVVDEAPAPAPSSDDGGEAELVALEGLGDGLEDSPKEAPVEPAEVEEPLEALETLEPVEDSLEALEVADDAVSASPELEPEVEQPAPPPPVSPPPAAARPSPPPPAARTTPTSPPQTAGTRPTMTMAAAGAAASSAADAAELRALRGKTAELQAALDEAQNRASESEARVAELQGQLEAMTAEVEAARSAGSRNDKEFFALKEASNKKDKEILRLKNELNEKDKEIVELREREMQLEQKVAESSGEMARRDAQVKTLTAKVDQLSSDRKRVDQELKAAKDEARSAGARLTAAQQELDASQAQLSTLQAELDEARSRTETDLQQARAEADDLRREVEATRAEVSQKAQLEEEAAGLRKRVAELEEATARHEERVTKLYARIKGDEKMRDKTKKALSIAMQLLEEPQADVGDEDEISAA